MEGDTQAIVNSSANEPKSDHVKPFLQQLEESERAPNGLAQIWQETKTAEQDSTGRIFLDAGSFSAWFAYIATKNAAESKSHFAGKAALRSLIGDLENTTTDYRKSLAAAVVRGVDPETGAKLQRMHDKIIKQSQNHDMSQQLSKRRRTTDGDGGSPTTSVNILSQTATSGSTGAYHSTDHPAREQRLVHRSPDSFAETDQVVVNASLAGTRVLFPPYLSKAIKRIPDPSNGNAFVAAISMTFPDARVTTKIECQMALEITDNKVEHLAMKLFDTHLETTEGLRYVCLPGAARALPNPKLTLRGCLHGNISPIFGPDICNAIMTSPAYQDEIKRGSDYTECVSMVISQGSHDGGVIFLSLGLREGALIKDKLSLL